MDIQPGHAAGREDLYAGLIGASRHRLMRALRGAPDGLDAHQLAAEAQLHVTTVRFHLDILRAAGMITLRSERAGRRGRPRLVYSAVPEPAGEEGYELLAELLAAHWDQGRPSGAQRAERAGREAAGPRLSGGASEATLDHAVEHIAARFDDLGFAPRLSREADAHMIELHACPFRSVAERHPDVVCSLHLGLIRGALEGMTPQPTATSLTPFLRPDVCLARIEPAAAGAPAPGRGRP